MTSLRCALPACAVATTAITALTGCAHLAPESADPPRRPNVVLIFTDDQGWADIGANGVRDDVLTPNIDALANEGVRFTQGYITAPQCSPSRAGLMTGQYQTRYNFEHIAMGPLPLDRVTMADRLGDAGYTTCMIGKWHLEPNHTNIDWARTHVPSYQGGPVVHLKWPDILPYLPDKRGFQYIFHGEMYRYWANYNLPADSPADAPIPRHIPMEGYRLDIQSDAAVNFIENHTTADDPFFMYLAYYAPHVPLEATEEYLSRFPDPDMHERRRYGLAMISAVDDGVGRIREALEAKGMEDDTLFIYIADNGAPLLEHTRDFPIDRPGGAWDGSLNDPWRGEKGMLMEGGIRVPFVMKWDNGLPSGESYTEPVIALDVAPTLLAAAGVQTTPADELDGVNILPAVRGDEALPDRALFWRFWGQAAVQRDDWKLVTLGDGTRLLYDLSSPEHETVNRIAEYPDKAAVLEAELAVWASQQDPPGIPQQPLNNQELVWYKQHAGLDY